MKLFIFIFFSWFLSHAETFDFNMLIEQSFRGSNPENFQINSTQQSLFRYLGDKYSCEDVKLCIANIKSESGFWETIFSGYTPGVMAARVSAVCGIQPDLFTARISGVFDIGDSLVIEIKNQSKGTYDTITAISQFVPPKSQYISYYHKTNDEGCDVSGFDGTLEYQLEKNKRYFNIEY